MRASCLGLAENYLLANYVALPPRPLTLQSTHALIKQAAHTCPRSGTPQGSLCVGVCTTACARSLPQRRPTRPLTRVTRGRCVLRFRGKLRQRKSLLQSLSHQWHGPTSNPKWRRKVVKRRGRAASPSVHPCARASLCVFAPARLCEVGAHGCSHVRSCGGAAARAVGTPAPLPAPTVRAGP